MADNEDERFAFITDEIIAELSDPTFDMWRYSREQLVPLIVTMYKELGLPEEYDIELDTLYNFVDTVRQNYSDSTPFHNFHHAFCVTQMVYCVLRATEAEEPFLNKFEKLALLISANIHDADHRGLTNNFYINSRDELAITYNDRSVLENHHCATGFRILSSPYCNILKNLSIKQYKEIRDIIVECVLSTDMSRHFKLRGEFMELVQAGIDWENSDNRKFVCQFILMCSDISNEVRPWWVSRPWATNLMEEFFAQTDLEKKMGMPFLPFMDRAQAKLENGQVGFIRGILRPIWVILADFLPVVAPYVDRIDSNLEHWQKFAEHERHRILVHMVAKDNSPGTIYDAGDVIVRMGEVSEEMYFIVRGAVDVLGPDMETVWDSMSKGAFFGEVGAFKQVPRTANIVAKVDSEVLVVRKDELLDLLEQFPEHQDVIKNVAEERFEKHKERLDDEHLVEFAG